MTRSQQHTTVGVVLIVIAVVSFRRFLVIRREPQRDWFCRHLYSRLWAASRDEWTLRLKFGYLWLVLLSTVGALAMFATA